MPEVVAELPYDLIIPPRLELSRDSFAEVAKLLATPRTPTKALQALMAASVDHKAS